MNLSQYNLSNILKSFPQLSNLSLASLPLNKYGLGSIPGLVNAPINAFQQWQQSFIGDIPGLSSVPFAQFPNPIQIANTGVVGQVDLTLGKAEGFANRSISGSYQEGFNVPCSQGNCAHVELGGHQLAGGKQWISGQFQKVRGGFGVLGGLFGGQEPTGRHPFGQGFKVAIWDINESQGTASTALFFRVCSRGWIDLGCSPYAIGPFPFLSYKEQDWMYLGV